ncbi:MAG: RHS repeat-associated core domain-containing protein [Pirellulaceae bacterium]|nr:RHS repeat-associated core domain-containing protein [Pirellulaceae bacterium]
MFLADLTRSQSWSRDAQGNWTALTNEDGDAQSRTHNAQNQITQVGSATLSYDAAGNMTTDEQGRTLVYDAWNRLARVQNGSTTVSQYQYDGLKRRIVEQQGAQTPRVLYYSANWQVLEERQSGPAVASHVWSPVYVDALVASDRDADGNTGNGLEQRLYALHDANFNVTALLGTAGAIVERYYYEAYGRATALSPDFVPLATGQSAYNWRYLHQGGQLDAATGLYHFRHRDLSTSLGRWLNLDPIGYQGSKWNLYEYVEGRPTRSLDPTGESSILFPPLIPDDPPGKPKIPYLDILKDIIPNTKKNGRTISKGSGMT